MGLSASQARLLTLTTRLADLELQSQQVSNSKIRLSTESEDVSRKYSDALNKENFTFYSGVNNAGEGIYGSLTYNNLTGVDSPLVSQYCVTDTNGNIVVPKDVAVCFESSSSLDEFLFAVGAKETIYPDGYFEAQSAARTARGAYDDAVTAEETALNKLNTYGSQYVEGYSTTPPGTWSYTRQEPDGKFMTNYTDSEVFSQLVNPANNSVNTYHSDRSDDVFCFYSDSSTPNDGLSASQINSAVSALSTCVSGITGDASNAVLAVIERKCNFADITTANLEAAAQRAAADTLNFYKTNLSSGNYLANPISDHVDNSETINYTAGTNGISDDTYGADEVYIDRTQVVSTFLAYFDAECDKINGGSGSYYSSEIKQSSLAATSTQVPHTSTTEHVNPTTTISTHTTINGAYSSTSTVTTYGTNTTYNTSTTYSTEYSITGEKGKTSRFDTSGTGGSDSQNLVPVGYSSAQGSPISMLPGGDSATYYEYLQTYNTSVSTLATATGTLASKKAAFDELAAKVYVVTSGDASYYINLYNKMAQGYVTISSDNASSKDWMSSQITSGNLLLQKYLNGDWQDSSWSSNTDIVKQSADTSETTKAESEYEADMAKIKTKDSRYDLELKNIDTEHSAIQTEIDSVKKVIDKNIERTFKTFDG